MVQMLEGLVVTEDETIAHQFDEARLLKACMVVVLAATNELRADPTTVKPSITAAAWRQRILDAYKALG